MDTTAVAVFRIFSLFEGSAIGVALSDLNGRHLRVNDRYTEITGYSREELQSITFASYTHPDDLLDNLALAQRMNQGEVGRAVFEKRYIRKTGEICWVRNSVSMIKNGRKPVYALVCSEDISEHRLAEQELLRTRDVLHKLSDSLGRLPVPNDKNTAAKAMTSGDLTSSLEQLRQVADQALSRLDFGNDQGDTLSESISSEDDFQGLQSALTRDLDRFTRFTGILVRLKVQPELAGLPPQLKQSVLRVVNVLLRHVYRFSGADAADVAVVHGRSGLTVEVRDTGRGSRPLIVSQTQTQTLRERIIELGGSFELLANRGGTLRRAVLPVA